MAKLRSRRKRDHHQLRRTVAAVSRDRYGIRRHSPSRLAFGPLRRDDGAVFFSDLITRLHRLGTRPAAGSSGRYRAGATLRPFDAAQQIESEIRRRGGCSTQQGSAASAIDRLLRQQNSRWPAVGAVSWRSRRESEVQFTTRAGCGTSSV
jgi:hypothetical protein